MQGVVPKKEALKHAPAQRAVDKLKANHGVKEETLKSPMTAFLIKNNLWNKKSDERLKHISLDAILVDWFRIQPVVMCDNVAAAKNADMTKDTYESVAFLRYGFNYNNPEELYVCKKKNKSR